MEIGEKDISKLHALGIKKEDLSIQISLLENLTEKINLVEAASLENGILSFTNEEEKNYVEFYSNFPENLELVNMVPASGAASRMFKSLINHLDTKKMNPSSQIFFDQLPKFPFFRILAQNFDSEILENLSNDKNQLLILDYLLNEDGLDYSHEPKGLIPFHIVEGQPKTAFEEHLRGSIQLLSDNKNVRLHFTVGLYHRDKIKLHLSNAQEKLSTANINIQYSLQSKTTDTVALVNENQLLRDENDEIVFRPGGHGSLLNNLNSIHADLIFLKNIDNVLSLGKSKDMPNYKSSMAGFLLNIKEKRDDILRSLDADANNPDNITKSKWFITNELSNSCETWDKQEDYIVYVKRQLNRPIRVCGMVKNEGEPGGGPFFAEKDGHISLQIVEASQIDIENDEQRRIMQSATHFNPVDIVCATRDHKGEKYNLFDFREESTSFISNKSYKGRDIKALEWPGLWNGGMYYWITFFVEIPSSAFNPVKTVNDLLNPAHQASK